MKYSYELGAYRIGTKTTVPLGEVSVTTKLSAPPDIEVQLLDDHVGDKDAGLLLTWNGSSVILLGAPGE